MRRPSTSISSGFTDLARSIADHSRQWRKAIFRWTKSSNRLVPHLRTGTRGERLAERFLRRNGYKILYRNFRSKRGGEIDLVCRDRRENALVFVEVKTRTTEMFGAPLQAVTLAKQQRSVRAAREWLRMLDRPDLVYRFDVVEVILAKKPQIRLTRAAFFDPADVYAP